MRTQLAVPLLASILILGTLTLAFTFDDAFAKVILPAKKIQVKTVDPLDTPLPDVVCEYAYDSLDRRILVTNNEGVANQKLVPPATRDTPLELKCEKDDLFFEGLFEFSDKPQTKIKVTLQPGDVVGCPPDCGF